MNRARPASADRHAGAKYGIPFPVLARASFGVAGARLPALARALVACGWYGVQTWIGGMTLLTLLGVMVGRDLAGSPLPILGIGPGQLAAYGLFWLAQLVFVEKGIAAVRRFETWTAPLKIVVCAALVWWALDRAGSRSHRRAKVGVRAGRREGRPVLASLLAGLHRHVRLLGRARPQHPGLHTICAEPAGPGRWSGSGAASPDELRPGSVHFGSESTSIRVS